VTLFLAHEIVVVGFVIFLTKLSTLTCMLHLLVTNFAKSWLDHYNIRKKRGTPPWYEIVGRHPRIRLAMVCESKGWEEYHTV
jgi:sterol desaturase/sphingolipid hydroxylase (fatty acid hydroxylase superfamily)